MGFFVAFLGMVAAAIAYAFKIIRGQTQEAEEAEKRAADAAVKVEEKRADLAAIEKAAEAAHLAVEQRLADFDKHIAEERARDSVDVANDIIGSK
jgi:Na+-transporting methylmalonyl-CoA/oxaloacetate decarboxylase gamma subunit